MITETPLLTAEQRKRLITREEKKESELDAYKKRHNDQVVLKKFSDYIESAPDLLLILKHMPPEKIIKRLKPDQIPALLDLVEELLARIDPWPIGVSEDENGAMASRVFGNAIPSADPGKCAIFSISRTATYEEAEFDHHLTDHFNIIRRYVDPCSVDPVCRDPEYIGMLGGQIFKIKKEFDIPFSASQNAYFDETGVSETGWILRKPSMVDIDQLQWMRWKPRGLKECLSMTEPPLLGEKKIPIQWSSLPQISDSSTPEEIEEFNKWLKEKNKMEIDEKDLLEVNEMIKKIPRSEMEYNDEDRKALKEKLGSLKWKQMPPSVEQEKS